MIVFKFRSATTNPISRKGKYIRLGETYELIPENVDEIVPINWIDDSDSEIYTAIESQEIFNYIKEKGINFSVEFLVNQEDANNGRFTPRGFYHGPRIPIMRITQDEVKRFWRDKKIESLYE